MFVKKIAFISLLSFAIVSVAQERNLKNIKKLTFGGDNAEAYFSPDSKNLTLQVTNKQFGVQCDQIYSLDLTQPITDFNNLKLVSTGKGRTTCSYFMPDGKHIIYASTHAANQACPAPPKPKDGKYLWPIYSEFEIYMADNKGQIVKQLTNSPGYDAEAVVSPDGKKIAFTSIRSGDLEIWTMDIDGTNLKQVTSGLGYDGGCFFSHDSKKLVFRSSRPKTAEEIKEYKDLLAENLVAPTNMEIYTCNVDGSDLKQITNLGKANWAPFFHPSDKKIIFSSNHHAVRGYDFQLYMINIDGTGLKQITWESEFNAFPMFSPDGKKLVFSSNRQGAPRETNVFIADWVDTDEAENIQTPNLKKHITYLASDALEGRLVGSKGEKLAATYIEQEFKKLKLKPYNNKYIHPFTYSYRTNPHDTISKGVEIKGHNVMAYIDNGAKNTIVIGAHYDHLGFNEHNNSTKPNSKGEIHNGADDNSSGVAGVLELARLYSQNKRKEKVNLIFALFSGEEDGLIGSKDMAETLKNYFPNVITMINMDMIGRLDDKKSLIVGGTGTSPLFPDLVEKNKPAGFGITQETTGIGPSDHTSFYLKDIPVLFLFTGTHQDYHKPSDDEDKINYYGVTNIVSYVNRLVDAIAEYDKVEFTKTKITSEKKMPKYKVTLGIMPDYTDHGDGLHVDGVTEGRPAQLAGIKEGDVITKIGDCEIKEVYSYMDCLGKINLGDVKEVNFIRNGKPMTVKVTF
ncbi:Probable M28 family aminopeptidase precursor [Flavobacterium indicum GPTSA100-9 = DSM 17447]|uniref:Probable M28 family aminopeptidase n=1 Tax=Flavobacterium indicum (strain DSM 17447 / CIP 109464 / GPTSA100-9) TaxID=1094466 RepID=H8XVC6_FLAIG|nr:M20/M25/M40 family metallo-hydrolase [Flavobacterium indicum]CCG53096.1 Probable M28 family aminopeptidase precursor [Flavobacterium indicum GPTSA100-9 = DSM 17447]